MFTQLFLIRRMVKLELKKSNNLHFVKEGVVYTYSTDYDDLHGSML